MQLPAGKRAIGVLLLLAASALQAAPQNESGQHTFNLASEWLNTAAESRGEQVRDNYIVTLEPRIARRLGVSRLEQAIDILLSNVGASSVLHTYKHAMTGMSLKLTPLQASLLERLPGVLRVEQDQVIQIAGIQPNATWGLDRMDQQSLPLDGSYDYPDSAGAGVNVYILDTGLRASHDEFAGRVIPGRNFAPNEGGGFLGWWGAETDPSNTTDCNGHGTHVAGSAAGSLYGVAKSANIAPVRVLGCNGTGSNSLVIAGLDWVAENHVKPAVANLSLGGGRSEALDDAVRNLVASGVTVVVAAGNSNVDACDGSPNRVAEAITVGATTEADTRASFSNYGSCVDVFAPGEGITSAWHTGDSEVVTISGTSMASPHVAGAAALYLSNDSSALPSEVSAALGADASIGALTDLGNGSPNLLAKVTATVGGGDDLDRPPVAAFTADCDELHCSFDGRGSSDDQAVASWDWDFGDGARASGEVVTHTFERGGNYTVKLAVADTSNLTAERSRTVTVADASACPECSRYTGNLSSGQQSTLSISDFRFQGGDIIGLLTGPAGTVFDLSLEERTCRWFVFCSWNTLATGSGTGNEKGLETRIDRGTYRWVIRARSGGGSFELLTNP